VLAAHHIMFFRVEFLHANLSATQFIFDIGILQPFLHLFFVQYLFEAFTIVDFYVLFYHVFR
jgi:hypothetical protein